MRKNFVYTFMNVMNKKILVLTASLLVPYFGFAGIADTIYYNNEGERVHPAMADYLRITFQDDQQEGLYQFVDKTTTGQKLANGSYRNSADGIRYEGTLKTYSPDGNVVVENHYENGLLNGKQFEYDGNGGEIVKLYKQGVIQGDYYYYIDAEGQETKFSTLTNRMVWESPKLSERQNAFSHGINWQYYITNHLVIDATCTIIEDYGKWYRIDVNITNGTSEELTIDPSSMFRGWVDGEFRPAWSFDDYMRKVQKMQNFEAVMTGISAGLNSYQASYTEQTVRTTTHHRGYTHTEYRTEKVYNPVGASVANLHNHMMITQMQMAHDASNAEKSENYLRLTTLRPGESVSGYVLIEKSRKDQQIIVKAYVHDAEYQFDWNVAK